MKITIRRGRDIALAGAPEQVVEKASDVRAVALVGGDSPGLRPSLQVEQGGHVSAGDVLFVDRQRPEIAYCSPASGTVRSITRGHRRTLDTVVVAVDGDAQRTFSVPRSLNAENLRALLLDSGLWPAFRTRPFERIPDPDAVPHAIFVTAIDTAPLAADPAVVLADQAEAFAAGLAAIRHLTVGPVYVCQRPGPPLAEPDDRIHLAEFAGPHPAGLPGTHIHHLMPAATDRPVWHIGHQDVAAVGHLIHTGRTHNERIVALGGSAVRRPRLLRTTTGADLNDLTHDELEPGNLAVLAGSVLRGRPSRYLGRYHTQVTALHVPSHGNRPDTGIGIPGLLGHDAPGPIVPIAAYDRVMALGIPATPLLRALAVGDAETAKRLGCLELAEDDVALLTHVCPARIDYAPLLRHVLDQIQEQL